MCEDVLSCFCRIILYLLFLYFFYVLFLLYCIGCETVVCLKFLEELVNTQNSALQRELILSGSEPLCKPEDTSWSP